MRNGYDYQCKCRECGAGMTSREFDAHDCPAIPKPIKGESFADYRARCDRFQADEVAS